MGRRASSVVGDGRGEVLERLAGEFERPRDVLMREKKPGVKVERALSVVFERQKLGEAEPTVEVEERWMLVDDGDIVAIKDW